MKHFDQIDHIAIVVSSIKNALKYYINTFKCKTIYSDSSWAILQFDNIKLSLVKEDEHPPHLAIINNLAINDPNSIEHRDGTISKYIKDVDGNHIELITYKKIIN